MPTLLHYGVAIKVLLQAVKRNLERFPEDFMVQLTAAEWAALRSQFVTSKAERGGQRYAPYAFTEQGVNPCQRVKPLRSSPPSTSRSRSSSCAASGYCSIASLRHFMA